MILVYSEDAAKQLKKIDKPIQKRIVKYMEEVRNLDDPRTRGKGLSSNLAQLWRYRVGDYRIICDIQDDKIIILFFHIPKQIIQRNI